MVEMDSLSNVDLANIDLNDPEQTKDLSRETLNKLKHQQLHEQHKGHEEMHAKMVLVMFGTLFAGQILLFMWRKKHPRSYNLATLTGMLFIPICYSIYFGFYRFIFIWVIYSLITGIVCRKASRRPLDRWTPRVVYGYFLKVFKLTYGVGIAGYTFFVLAFFGFPTMFLISPETWLDFAILLLFYGVYFGVITKDIADMCTDRMASTIGYFSEDGMPMKHLDKTTCGICGELNVGTDENGQPEKQHKLPCGHIFHEFCIRGWVIVGKKQTCPACKEKVDLKQFSSTPWERVYIMYSGFLDWCRFMVCWMPIIMGIVQGINHVLGYE